MGKVIRFYKPTKAGKALWKEEVFHKPEVVKFVIDNWAGKYGSSFVEIAKA